MEARIFFFICFIAASAKDDNMRISLWNDPHSLRVRVSNSADLQCCYKCTCSVTVIWIRTVMITHNSSLQSPFNETKNSLHGGLRCSHLQLNNVGLNDTGLYQCQLSDSHKQNLSTAGTFLQVFEPIHKTLNISESAKNSIITAEGVLLLLCVLLPGIMLICKSKGLHELDKRKGKEEENIYEGLNLEDCTSTYHQIQRSLVQGPYQDVANTVEEDIQLEKP